MEEIVKKYMGLCKLFEVSYDCDNSTLKKAYHRKLKEFHPDINKSEQSTHKTKELIESFNSFFVVRKKVIELLSKQKVKVFSGKNEFEYKYGL